MNLIDKLKTMDKPEILSLKSGFDVTIADFWNSFVKPMLPDKNVVIKIYELLKKYVEDDDAVFAIRTFGNWKDKKHDNKDLRRGFYNLTDSNYSFFYTDNFFAAYFCKMAIDGFVPDYNEFKEAMITREFPARFGRHDSIYEKKKAAYSIDGTKGKDPLFTKKGYKIAHIVNSGKDFLINEKDMTIKEICDIYCPRGDYNDWTINQDTKGDFFARMLKMDPFAKEIIKAHFLRFSCPLNYILTPGTKHHTTLTKIYQNDIAESPELQQYAMEQFKKIYGEVYDEYLSKIMLSPTKKIDRPGDFKIYITYGYGIRNGKHDVKKTVNKLTEKDAKNVGLLKVGKYVYNLFEKILQNDLLTESQIEDLKNKAYCSKKFGITYPVLVEQESNNYEKKRYYKKLVVDKYYVCSQWYDRNRVRIDNWLTENNIKIN